MVGQGGSKDPEGDRPGLLKTSSEDQCEQLGFVPHFGQGHNAEGDEERFHVFYPFFPYGKRIP